MMALLVTALLASEAPREARPIPVLGVASIFHAEYLLRCIRSIDHPVDTLVVVHNGKDPQVGAAVETLQLERPAMRVVRVPENSGCAGGWNRIIAANSGAPWWLVVNDDIAFPPGALATLASEVWHRVETQPKQGHFKFWYQHNATGWSCFALTNRAFQATGTFDENIYPVYFEDQVGDATTAGRDGARHTRCEARCRTHVLTSHHPHAPGRTTSGGSRWPASPRST